MRNKKKARSLLLSLVMCMSLGVNAYAEYSAATIEQETAYAAEILEEQETLEITDVLTETEEIPDSMEPDINMPPEEVEESDLKEEMTDIPEEEVVPDLETKENATEEKDNTKEKEENTDEEMEQSEGFSSIWTDEYLQQYAEYREAILNEANELTEGVDEYDFIDWENLDYIDEEILNAMYSPMLLANEAINGQITKVDTHYFNGTMASAFTVSYDGTNYKAFCMQHQNLTSPAGTTVNVSREEIMMKMYMCAIMSQDEITRLSGNPIPFSREGFEYESFSLYSFLHVINKKEKRKWNYQK